MGDLLRQVKDEFRGVRWQGPDHWEVLARSGIGKEFRGECAPASDEIYYRAVRNLLKDPNDSVLAALISADKGGYSRRASLAMQIVPDAGQLSMLKDMLGGQRATWDSLARWKGERFASQKLAGVYYFLDPPARCRALLGLLESGLQECFLSNTVHDLWSQEWQALRRHGIEPEKLRVRLRPPLALANGDHELENGPPWIRYRIPLPPSQAPPQLGADGRSVVTSQGKLLLVWDLRNGRQRERYYTAQACEIESIYPPKKDGDISVTPHSQTRSALAQNPAWRLGVPWVAWRPKAGETETSCRQIDLDDKWSTTYSIDASLDGSKVHLKSRSIDVKRWDDSGSYRHGASSNWSLDLHGEASFVWFDRARPELFVVGSSGIWLSDARLSELTFYPSRPELLEVAEARYLILGPESSEVSILDLDDRTRRVRLRGSKGADYVHLSPDCDLAAGVDADGLVTVWNARVGERIWKEAPGEEPVTHLRWSEDRSLAAVRETGEVDFFWYLGTEHVLPRPGSGAVPPAVLELLENRYSQPMA